MLEMLARVECDGVTPYAQIVDRAMVVTGRSGLAVLFGLEDRAAQTMGSGMQVPHVAEGMGRVVGEADLSERVYAALHGKYGWHMTLLDFGSRLGAPLPTASRR